MTAVLSLASAVAAAVVLFLRVIEDGGVGCRVSQASLAPGVMAASAGGTSTSSCKVLEGVAYSAAGCGRWSSAWFVLAGNVSEVSCLGRA